MIGRRFNVLASLRELPRDLRLLFWSFFLWTFGLGLYNYVWPLFLEQLHATPGQVGLVFAIGFVAVAVTLIPGGILANRYELKTLLILGWILSIPVPLVYYFAGTWTDVIPGIVLLQVSGFNIPAFNAYIVGAGEKAKVASNFGTIWAAAPLGIVFSPAVGSLLLTVFRIRDIFIISFVFFTVSTIVLFFIKPQPPLEQDVHASKLEVPRTLPEVTLLIYLTGAAIAVDISSPFLPLYFHDIFGLQPATIQLLGAAQSLGSATFAILLSKRADTASPGRTMATGLLFSMSGILGITLTGSPLFAFPLVFLFGSARAPSLIAYSILSNIRRGASRAGQYGFYLTLESLGFVGGSLLGGVLYTINPAIGLYTTAGLFFVLAIVAMLTKFQSKRTLEIQDIDHDGKEFKAAHDKAEGIGGPV